MKDKIRNYLRTNYPNIKIENIEKAAPTYVRSEDGKEFKTADPILYHIDVHYEGKPYAFSISEARNMESEIEARLRERNIKGNRPED